MRRLSRVSIVTVFAIALTQMAMAADLPRKAPAYTPPLPPVFNAQAGYNWQINNWVLGIEADFQGAAIKGSVLAPIFLVAIPILSAIESAIEKLEWFGTVRGRLGSPLIASSSMGPAGSPFCIRRKNRLDRRWWHRMGIRRQTVDQDRGSLLRSRFALFSWQRCKWVYGG